MEPHYYGYLLMRLRSIDLLNLHVQWNLTITVTYSWDYATLTFLIYMYNGTSLYYGYLLMGLRNIDLLNLHVQWNLTITVTYSWDYATLTFLIYMYNGTSLLRLPTHETTQHWPS